MAAAVNEGPSGDSSTQQSNGFTTEQLESDTRQFIETKLMKRRLTEEPNRQVDSKLKKEQERTLQKANTRKWRQQNRNGKGGKNNDWHPSWDRPRRDRPMHDDDDDDVPMLGGLGSGLGSRMPGRGDWHGGSGKSGKWWGGGSGKSGKWGGGGSGKSGKWWRPPGGKWDDDGHYVDDDDDGRWWDDKDWPHKEVSQQ